MAEAHYRRPGWFTRHVFNRLVEAMTATGLSVWGSRVLEVPGRVTQLSRRTPVNLLDFDGRLYLVSPRGEGEWVRNVRANAGMLTLIHGRRREQFVAHEIADLQKPPVLRAYLKRWKMEVGVFFDGVDGDSLDEELLRIASRHPVFLLEASGS